MEEWAWKGRGEHERAGLGGVSGGGRGLWEEVPRKELTANSQGCFCSDCAQGLDSTWAMTAPLGCSALCCPVTPCALSYSVTQEHGISASLSGGVPDQLEPASVLQDLSPLMRRLQHRIISVMEEQLLARRFVGIEGEGKEELRRR